jgi:Putative cyclase
VRFVDDSSWAVKNGNNYKACEGPAHRISTADLDKVAKDQGVELRIGDILFLRTGYTEWYNNSDTEERVRVAKQYPPDIAGIEQTEESVRWLWYAYFMAFQLRLQGPPFLGDCCR